MKIGKFQPFYHPVTVFRNPLNIASSWLKCKYIVRKIRCRLSKRNTIRHQLSYFTWLEQILQGRFPKSISMKPRLIVHCGVLFAILTSFGNEATGQIPNHRVRGGRPPAAQRDGYPDFAVSALPRGRTCYCPMFGLAALTASKALTRPAPKLGSRPLGPRRLAVSMRILRTAP